VREEVLAARVGRDEAEALSIVEPFDDTSFHVPLFLNLIRQAMPLMPITIHDSANREYMRDAQSRFRHRKSSKAFIRGSGYKRQAVSNRKLDARQMRC
jgi:hypothetical protein